MLAYQRPCSCFSSCVQEFRKRLVGPSKWSVLPGIGKKPRATVSNNTYLLATERLPRLPQSSLETSVHNAADNMRHHQRFRGDISLSTLHHNVIWKTLGTPFTFTVSYLIFQCYFTTVRSQDSWETLFHCDCPGHLTI